MEFRFQIFEQIAPRSHISICGAECVVREKEEEGSKGATGSAFERTTRMRADDERETVHAPGAAEADKDCLRGLDAAISPTRGEGSGDEDGDAPGEDPCELPRGTVRFGERGVEFLEEVSAAGA